MPQTLIKLYAHIVWGTKKRYPYLAGPIKYEVFSYISHVCKKTGCTPLIVGGHDDHIHVLCVLPKDETLTKVMQTIKAFSSKWIKSKGPEFERFSWQGGYGAFSVHPSQVETVRKYIARQDEHHRKRDYRSEYHDFLKEYGLEYNEKNLWD